MIGFIVSMCVLGVIGFAGIKVGKIVEAKVGGVKTLSAYSRAIGSAAAPLAAFMIFAIMMVVVAPPADQFGVANVDWSSRHGGVLGGTADAILVRTTGANVEPGLLYSEATLSGQKYVGLPTAERWIAVKNPALAATFFYTVVCLLIASLTGALMLAKAAYEKYGSMVTVSIKVPETKKVEATPATAAEPTPAPTAEPTAAPVAA